MSPVRYKKTYKSELFVEDSLNEATPQNYGNDSATASEGEEDDDNEGIDSPSLLAPVMTPQDAHAIGISLTRGLAKMVQLDHFISELPPSVAREIGMLIIDLPKFEYLRTVKLDASEMPEVRRRAWSLWQQLTAEEQEDLTTAYHLGDGCHDEEFLRLAELRRIEETAIVSHQAEDGSRIQLLETTQGPGSFGARQVD